MIHPGYIYTFESTKEHCDKFIVFLQRDLTNIESQSTNQLYHYMKDIVLFMAIKYIDEVYVYQTEEELYKLIEFLNLI